MYTHVESKLKVAEFGYRTSDFSISRLTLYYYAIDIAVKHSKIIAKLEIFCGEVV